MNYNPSNYSYKINDKYYCASRARDFLVMMLFMKNAFNPHFDPKIVDPDRLLQELICQYEASGYLGEPMELMCSTPFCDYKFTIKRRKQ